MPSSKTKYLAQVIYVARFREPDATVRFMQADAERAFSPLLNCQSTQTNVPDNFDPNSPRIVFQTGHKTLVISQVACQLSLNFEKGVMPFDRQLDVARKNIIDFNSRLTTFKTREAFIESAFVMNINIPSDLSQQEMHNHLAERFLKSDPLGELASFSLKVGYKTPENLFLNLETDVYEMRRAEMPTPDPSGAPTFMLIDEFPIVEKGFGVKLDVNDKPRMLQNKTYVTTGPEELISRAFAFVNEQLDEEMGFEHG